MSNKFRVRETDDPFNTYCVADGSTFATTKKYIRADGVVSNCKVYHTKAEAESALLLYLKNNQPAKKLEIKSSNPKTQHGHPRFYEMLEAMAELHSRKNHDYAGTSDPLKNLRACKRLELKPFMGVMVRLQDKWSRLEEFVKSGKLMVKGESVKDTLMDNAVYSILAIILYEEEEKYNAAVDHETGVQ